uniref:Uncharacterized protein n=2 Tax=Meloidogyne TaxID=189290 RepID=A0A6V7UBN9_MELEN|nr:unnamed protein product [Meloidogyne enterolobii]
MLIFSDYAPKLYKFLEEIFNDAKKRYGDSKFSKNVFELSYNHDHELITKHIHQTYFVVEIRKIFCGIFDFAKNCKKSKKKESEKNGRTESTTPLIDEDYDDDDSNKEEDCNLDLDKVAIFKRVCKVFQKENSNDRVELLRLKGFDELDSQTNNLDLEKLKKDLAKIKKQQNPTKEKENSWRKFKKAVSTIMPFGNKGDIEPPRRSFELDRPGSNITDPARKSFTGIHQSLLDYDSYYSDDGQQSRQSLDLPLLKHQQIFHKENQNRHQSSQKQNSELSNSNFFRFDPSRVKNNSSDNHLFGKQLIDLDHHQSDNSQKQNPELNKSDSFKFVTTSGPINLSDKYSYGNPVLVRQKRLFPLIVPAIAFGGAIFFQQFFKKIIGTKRDPIQWIIDCVMNIKTGGCKVPEAIQNERSFLVTAKKLVIEEMTMEAVVEIRKIFEIYYLTYLKDKIKPTKQKPPSIYLKNLNFALPIKYGYILDCYYYDWDKEYEKMTEKMKEEDSKIKIPQWLKDLKSNPNLLTPLIKVSIQRCKPFENFIEEDKIPEMLIHIDKHCSMPSNIFIRWLEASDVELNLGIISRDDKYAESIRKDPHFRFN